MDKEHIYYHVTLLRNVPSIRKHGLIPQLGERSIEGNELTPGVFLFPTKADMENALSNWLGQWYNEHYGEDCPLAILQVRLPSDVLLEKTNTDYEVVCRTVISSACIRFFDEQGRPLTDFDHIQHPTMLSANGSLPVLTTDLFVAQAEIDYIKELMQMTGGEIYDKYGLKRDETITNTLHFEDGSEIDVKVVICDEDKMPYIDIALFDKNGCERACDVGEDSIEGEFSFETKDAIYKGAIKPIREKEMDPAALSLDKIIDQAEHCKTKLEHGDVHTLLELFYETEPI